MAQDWTAGLRKVVAGVQPAIRKIKVRSETSCFPLAMELEHEAQRQLDLSRASDGLVRDAQAAQRRADVWRLTGSWKAIEVDVLGHVANRDIETRSIGHVEHRT